MDSSLISQQDLRRTHLSTLVPQPLHKQLRLMAILEGISLNDLVLRALEAMVAQPSQTNQHGEQVTR
jgi:predicted HicB family RNase H-like nuclease